MSFLDDPVRLIYLDLGGRGPGLVRSDVAALPVTDRGFLYGDGLFETMLAVDGHLPLLADHLTRLARSAAVLAIPLDQEGAAAAAFQIAQSAGEGTWAIRLTLSRGSTPGRGYAPPAEPAPVLLVTAHPYIRPAGPLAAVTASLRVNPASPLTRHKSLSALEKVMARAEAARAGVDEAILLNTAGRVAEGAASNLFWLKGGHWFTPPLSEGCLPGVMRGRLLTLTGANEHPLTVAELWRADGVYLSNSLMGCLPLSSIDGEALRPGPTPPSIGALLGG